MKTKVIRIDENDIDRQAVEEAGEILKRGGLVAFPTETVYGLGGDALNGESSARIYAAKGRPSDNPLIIHIADMDALSGIAVDVPKKAYLLADRYWPGPLTMIFHKADLVPHATTGGLETVAVRMPSHKTARALIRAAGGFAAAERLQDRRKAARDRAPRTWRSYPGGSSAQLHQAISMAEHISRCQGAEPSKRRHWRVSSSINGWI